MDVQSRNAVAAGPWTKDIPASDRLSTPSPAEPIISFEAVTKSYLRSAGRALLRHRLRSWFTGVPTQKFCALNSVTFSLPRGASLGVVGANGAGKSTLLRIATGIAAPNSGRVEVRGTVAALMELGAGFHPDLTGRSTLEDSRLGA